MCCWVAHHRFLLFYPRSVSGRSLEGGTALIARRRGVRDSGARLGPRCGRSYDQAVLSGLHFRFAPRQATLG